MNDESSLLDSVSYPGEPDDIIKPLDVEWDCETTDWAAKLPADDADSSSGEL